MVQPVPDVQASMEPCLFRHGKGSRSSSSTPPRPALMEPCLFRHGKKISYSWEL